MRKIALDAPMYPTHDLSEMKTSGIVVLILEQKAPHSKEWAKERMSS